MIQASALPQNWSATETAYFFFFATLLSAVMYGTIWALDHIINGPPPYYSMPVPLKEPPVSTDATAAPTNYKALVSLLSHLLHARITELERSNAETELFIQELQTDREAIAAYVTAARDGDPQKETVLQRIADINFEGDSSLEHLEEYAAKSLEDCSEMYKKMIRNEEEMQYILEERAKL